MSTGKIPQDDRGKAVLALWNDATQHAIPVHVGAIVTGSDGNTYAKLDANVTIANANANGQSTMANSAPVVIASDQTPLETLISYYTKKGQVFVATTGVLSSATNNNLTVGGMCIFNSATSGKNILIYSLQVGCQDSAFFNIKLGTADEAFGNSIVPQNANAGSGTASVVTCDSSANGVTTSVTTHGTTIMVSAQSSTSASADLFTNGFFILLPAGSAHSLNVYPFVATATHQFYVNARWIEY